MSYFDNDYLDVPSYEFLQRYPKVYAGTNIHLDGEVAKIISEDGKRYEIVLWVIQSFTEYFANKYPLDEAGYYMMNFPEEYEPYLAQMQGAYITVTGDLGDTWFVEGDHIELFGRYIEMSSKYTVSFVVTPAELANVVIKVNGQEVANPVDLEAGTYTVEVNADNCEVFNSNITITADTATHTQTIAMTYLPSDYTKFIEAIAAFVTKVETSPFSDVSTSAYYYEAVKWAQEKGITGGIGNGLFGPNQPCTRAQIVTFLWRAAGSPVVNYAMNMSDVPEGSYYAEAVRWALSEGIATGTTGNTFSPDSECTRAQAVAFLFRYAASEAVTLQELVSGFSDADSVPGYALPAMNWALAEEIVQGNGSKLMPNDSCTRAQIVTFLFRAYQGK